MTCGMTLVRVFAVSQRVPLIVKFRHSGKAALLKEFLMDLAREDV